ncbi:MAG: hypothetical protein V7776_23535, partial [Halopseudomonas aestusnigri]
MTPQEILTLYRAGHLRGNDVKALLQTIDDQESNLPLNSIQQGLWSLQVGRPSMTAYNVPLGLRVPKDVSEPRLAAAF